MAERALDQALPATDAVDEELVALAAPPNTQRLVTVGVMSITAALCVAMLLSLRTDLAYLVSSAEAVRLGSVNELNTASLPINRHVELEGAPMLSHAAKYQTSMFGITRVITPFAGQRGVLISLPKAQFEDPASLSGHRFTGRLLPLHRLRNMDSVKTFLETRANYPVSGETLVLLASDPPEAQLSSALLATLAFAFVLVNFWLIVRWFRPLGRPSQIQGKTDSVA